MRRALIDARKEEAQDCREAGGPGGFVVNGAFGALVGEVDACAPAAFVEALIEEVGVAQVTETFGRADVEPDSEIWAVFGVAEEGEDAAVVPPYRGAEDS